ncbi:pilus assembly protein [Aromatoleum buckelii]|uniref:Pilus assembly protein n=1 Tax=Aromatoleum buckelii TaxID=200254 RepID=A0ABX1MZR4_9RHOO|nr:pilus assembly protein [Aromatoleum buckelii]MCK0510441.1 pilus assembly protein [Aromatoleum buckelii]
MNAFARLTAALAALALTGCVATSPNWDSRFGEAARTTAAQQIIFPEASKNTDPVAGIDGKAAQGAMGEYAKSYTTPEPQASIMTIGIGASGQ